jgi:D-alanine-D-alanine ligase
LDDAITEQIRTMAAYVFKLLGCSGIARVDFLYDKDLKKIYANEVNTLPGTLYHHLWDKSGVSLSALLARLIAYALERHRAQQKLIAVFESDILKQADWSQKFQKQ